jgi:two-component system chemotaxis response regulator CheB
MRDQGALTIAQDEQSSVVYGMPGEASRLDAADHVLPPSAIASMLNQIFKNKKYKS